MARTPTGGDRSRMGGSPGSGSPGSGQQRRGTTQHEAHIGGPAMQGRSQMHEDEDSYTARASGLYEEGRQRAKDAYESGFEAAQSAYDWAGERGSALTDYAQRRMEGMREYFSDNPMMLGAVGLGVGLLVGALLPVTRTERRILEPVSDQVRSGARQAMEKMREQVDEMGSSGAGQAHFPHTGEGPRSGPSGSSKH